MIQQITTPWYSAQYTFPLYQLLEEYASKNMGIPLEQVHNLPVQEIIQNSHKSLFDFPYPMWEESYRDTFEINFCNYFYTREVGSETEKLFKQRLLAELTIKMPYYNQMYESTTWMKKYNVDPVANTDYTESYEKKIDGTGQTKTDSGTKGKNEGYTDTTNSETPQGMLSGLDYATTANKAKAITETDSTANQKTVAEDQTKEEYTFHRKGNIGVQTFADIIMSNRDSFINVDLMVFLDLTQLFMLVY